MHRRTDCILAMLAERFFSTLALIAGTIRRAALASIAFKFALARGIAQSAIFLRNRWSEKGVGVLRGKPVFRVSPCSGDSSRYRWNFRNRCNLHFSNGKNRYVLYLSILPSIENYPSSWLSTILFSSLRTRKARWEILFADVDTLIVMSSSTRHVKRWHNDKSVVDKIR